MKKVIFICLLSLTVCLSKAADGTAGTPAPAPQGSNKNPEVQPAPAPAPPNASSTQTPTAAPSETTSTPVAPITKPTKTTGNDDGNTPGNKSATTPASASTTEQTPPTPSQPTSSSTTISTTTTTTTVRPQVTSTEAPKEEDKIVQARGFDGASFIGGIILTLGLLAIGFMGFKYYKNQTERNYHTL